MRGSLPPPGEEEVLGPLSRERERVGVRVVMRTIGLIVKRAPGSPPRCVRVRGCAVRASIFGALVATATSALDAQPVLTATTVAPRAFGYQVGDVVSGTVRVHIPNGLALDEASLPQPGARGKTLELRSVGRRNIGEAGGQRLEVRLEYQVFLSPAQTRTLETPTLTLRFVGQPRDQTLRIEPWPVTVAPLAPVDVSPRRGLGELQPDASPPLIVTTAARWRLLAEGLVAVLLLGYLAHVYIGAPWWARSQRPFNRAWGDLRQMRDESVPRAASPSRAAMQRLHAALNASAGEVVFEAGIDRFVSARPRFRPLREDLVAFLRLSSREFFAPGAPGATRPTDASAVMAGAREDDPLPWLIAFCRRCRDAERGSA
jgi:mxaA protein